MWCRFEIAPVNKSLVSNKHDTKHYSSCLKDPSNKDLCIIKYQIDYFFCKNCGFLQTEKPYWLEEAYKDSINDSDTGYLQRNVLFSKKTLKLFSLLLFYRCWEFIMDYIILFN